MTTRVIAVLVGCAVLASTVFAKVPSVTPQSQEAWAWAAREGAKRVSLVYAVTPEGLVCAHPNGKSVRERLEAAARDEQLHPALVAEELAAYLWSDWTLFYISGYDLRAVIDGGNPDDLAAFLEASYQEQHVCFLGVLTLLVDGYEGEYGLSAEGEYVRGRHGDPYSLLAFDPRYFPGNGVFEPLGIVHAVKMADLLQIGWVRSHVLKIMAETLERRAAEGDALKLTR